QSPRRNPRATQQSTRRVAPGAPRSKPVARLNTRTPQRQRSTTVTNETPTPPAAPEPHQTQEPSAAQPTQPVYQQPQYAPREVRPPLTKRAKTGATWAGIIGFNLLTVGFFVFLAPLALLAMGSLVQWAVSMAIQQGT